jgi:hypothetical protein
MTAADSRSRGKSFTISGTGRQQGKGIIPSAE